MPFELNPNETTVKLVSFFIPQTTLADSYKVEYIIKDRQYPTVGDVYTTEVTVLPVKKLHLQLLQSPKFVIAGEEYKCSFIVTNQGNLEYTIATKINSSRDVPYTTDAESFKLAPGRSKTVVVKVKTNTDTNKKFIHYLRFVAETAEDAKTRTQTKSSVEIIPRVSGVADNYHRIPAELIVRYVSEKNDSSDYGFQTELSGEGTLDEQGCKHIKFRFRGPDVQKESIFGQRDEYYASYWTDDYELHLGDRSYSLSPLTENYLYGRGIEGRLNINDCWSFGAYHMRTRWLEPATEETAAVVDYRVNEKYKFGLNYLRKLKDSKLSDIVSFEGELKPFRDTRIEFEYALGPGGSKNDNAYLTRLYGRNDSFSYYLKLTHAGPDYPGYYSDLDYFSAGLTIPIDKRLRINANFRREKSNLDCDPTDYSAPLEKYYQLGADYRLQNDIALSFDWLVRDRRDRLDSPQFDYRENTFRFGIGRSFDKLSLRTSAELGRTKNKLTGSTADSQRYTASAYFKPNKKQFYSFYLYYDNESDFTGENSRSMTVGLNTRYSFTPRTFFNLILQTNDYQGSSRGARDNLEARLAHAFKNENEISVFARHTRYEDSSIKDETALMVQYKIPLGIPVCLKTSVGGIKGYVYDQQLQSPAGNVILRLGGLTAVTDNNGRFHFPSVKPGIHYLNIDTASIGLDRIPNRKTPVELTVQGGQTTQLDVPITQSAQLTGTIKVCTAENSSGTKTSNDKSSRVYLTADARTNSPNENYGPANTVVELKNSSEVKRTFTNRNGSFEFRQIRPAKWTLKIHADNLPQYHYLEQDTFEIELQPGEKAQIIARVLPKKRRIRIIAEPQNLSEEQGK